jgi:hypothetical protein
VAVTVTVSVPTGAVVAEHEALPPVSEAEHRVVVPLVKTTTVPPGVPLPELGAAWAE